jgi:hypothetical protein
MPRPSFNTLLQPLLHHHFNAPKLTHAQFFCSSATFGCSAPTIQHVAATLFHHCFNAPKPTLKIWKCFAHSTKCFIFCPSATFGCATPIVQCTAATLVPLLIHCTQALMVPSDHSISLPLLSVPLVLPETSKVSFFFASASVVHCATFLCICICICICNHTALIFSSRAAAL